MSNLMAQILIRNVLQALLGINSPELRFYMRPDNRVAQFFIAHQLLRHYVEIDNAIEEIVLTSEEQPGGRQVLFNQALFRAIISDIDEELEQYSQEAINTQIRDIIVHGPHPPRDPLFFTGLFPPAPSRT